MVNEACVADLDKIPINSEIIRLLKRPDVYSKTDKETLEVRTFVSNSVEGLEDFERDRIYLSVVVE